MMQGIDLAMLAAANNTTLLGENALVSGVSIDSRHVADGDIFIALKGERVDGHQYLDSAAKSGAVGAVVETAQDIALPQIVVDDARRALAEIAKVNRAAYRGKVVAITGSAGKTSCKNMLASILGQAGTVCATQGNLNNELGLPLTVQRLNEQHDFAVLEMGAAQAGDIDYLVRIGKPHVSAVTNVNEAHVGRFGSIEITAKTKGEIYNSLPENGFAVINADDQFAPDWREQIQAMNHPVHMIECALENPAAHLYASDVQLDNNGLSFTVNGQFDSLPIDAGDTIRISLALVGRHNIANALIAIAMARALGITDQQIIGGLAEVKPEQGRLCLTACTNGLHVLDDSYNANPRAIEVAVDTLLDLKSLADTDSACIVVLGDMAELGDYAKALHYQVGEYAGKHGIDRFYVIGQYASDYVDGYNATASGPAAEAKSFDALQPLIDALQSEQNKDAFVLVKGSRSAAMERVVAALAASSTQRGQGLLC